MWRISSDSGKSAAGSGGPSGGQGGSGTAKRRAWLAVLLVAALLLSACFEGKPVPTQLSPQDAWTDEVPAGATMVSEEEFRRLLAAGEIVLRSTAGIAAEAVERDRQFAADVDYLSRLASPSSSVQALLEEVGDGRAYVPDAEYELPDGSSVVLLGLGSQLRDAVIAEEKARDQGEVLELYTHVFGLSPEEVRARAVAPAGLAGSSAAEVWAALAELDALLGELDDLSGAYLEPLAVPPAEWSGSAGELAAHTLRPGAGSDEGDTCPAAPTGLVAKYWFPLKNFLPPMKDQGSRGTCWAFAAIGAVETRERVQRDNAVNLSEQFLVNKVKEHWEPSEYEEGHGVRALTQAVTHDQPLMLESGWTYNPSLNRPLPLEAKASSFKGACDPYGDPPNGGTCSETAHQSEIVCSRLPLFGNAFTYCAARRVEFAGPGVPSGQARLFWLNGQAFNLNSYVQQLAKGHVIMAGYPVYPEFDAASASGGIVEIPSLEATGVGMSSQARKSRGDHVVQIVGFLSNAQLSRPGVPARIEGGGYFIVKNSWGCNAGDAGYYYVPAAYVERYFTHLHILLHGSTRGSNWAREQRTPGTLDPPTIRVADTPTVELRAVTDLTDYFSVRHPMARGVDLTITSNRDGVIYRGGRNIDPMAFQLPIEFTFTSTGPRELTITAATADRSATATMSVYVWNSPPVVQLEGSGAPHVGVPYGITALVSDVNEDGTDLLCRNTTWTVGQGVTLSPATGCLVQVTFTKTGRQVVSATTRDSEGLFTTARITLDVQPPPENPNPRIATFGISRRYALTATCLLMPIEMGATIDLTAIAPTQCRPAGAASDPPLYAAYVTVENPDNEPLTYDWRLYVTSPYNGERLLKSQLGSASSRYDLRQAGASEVNTEPCRVTVRVNAPDPARSKSLTVWTGNCRYTEGKLG